MMGNVVEHLETHISHRMTIYYDVKGGEFFLLASAGFLFFVLSVFFHTYIQEWQQNRTVYIVSGSLLTNCKLYNMIRYKTSLCKAHKLYEPDFSHTQRGDDSSM